MSVNRYNLCIGDLIAVRSPFEGNRDRDYRDRRSDDTNDDTPIAIVIAIRKIHDQAKNRDLDRDQNGDRTTLVKNLRAGVGGEMYLCVEGW